ncbi:peroxiredoxin [Phaeovulum vinaykumarii]|uniref:thioredoxin-dependent peroxiredoxin n=1 Tax=Phaeovulum vinaykumarii TaxID=407234 RepID=A0A1N7L589_9RHOB|nr:peroxiredoxin [Phaeovulum vinaykumarii]SIS69022.1 peroxiredoxin Q/BCP [Phaeovulum vinaykumarii]SOB99716.1 peroxiredoxin Q/BCP [Phaeovulum vinaykumarii]
MPEIGETAPDFTLPVTGGDDTLSLASLSGRKVVLYFYPRDDTPGCTTEALDFTRLAAEFDAAGTTVLGISRDTLDKHEKFCAKHGLGIPLLSDAEGDTCERYGVWVEKKMYGRSSMGIERTTFLIGADGRIAQIWRKVKVKGHAEEVLAAARDL